MNYANKGQNGDENFVCTTFCLTYWTKFLPTEAKFLISLMKSKVLKKFKIRQYILLILPFSYICIPECCPSRGYKKMYAICMAG